MPTQFITLKDGIRIEAEVTDTRVAAKDGRVEQTIDSIKPTLVRVVQPVVAAWDELNQDMDIQQAEIGLRSPYRPLLAAQNDRLSPPTPRSSSAEVFLPRTEAAGVAATMINA